MKKMVLIVGYTSYAFEPSDALALLAVAARGTLVTQEKYNEPYHEIEGDPLVTQARMVDVVYNDPQEIANAAREAQESPIKQPGSDKEVPF